MKILSYYMSISSSVNTITKKIYSFLVITNGMHVTLKIHRFIIQLQMTMIRSSSDKSR